MFDFCAVRFRAPGSRPSPTRILRVALTALLLNGLIAEAHAAAPGAAGAAGAAGGSSGAAGAAGGSSGAAGAAGGSSGAAGGSSGAAGAAGGSSGAAGASSGAGAAGGSSGANGGGASGSGGGGGGGGHAPPSIDAPTTTSDPGDNGRGVKQATEEAEEAIAACPDDPESVRCLAAVLDAYAQTLRELSPHLPPALRSLPDIVARAARSVRHAKSKPQALAALRVAIAQVHKTLSLAKADDPVLRRVETRDGALVAETLAVAGDKLEKAAGL
jgi:hypothetical protein